MSITPHNIARPEYEPFHKYIIKFVHTSPENLKALARVKPESIALLPEEILAIGAVFFCNEQTEHLDALGLIGLFEEQTKGIPFFNAGHTTAKIHNKVALFGTSGHLLSQIIDSHGKPTTFIGLERDQKKALDLTTANFLNSIYQGNPEFIIDPKMLDNSL